MKPSSRHPDVVVVGAGVVGTACAFALARDGIAVTLVDGSFVGGGSTGVAMGHVVVLDDSEAQLALGTYSRQLWSALAPELPPDCEDDRCGTIWVATDDAELAIARTKRDVYHAHGVDAILLDARDLRVREPFLRPDLAGGLYVPDDRVIYPPSAARFLARRARELGAKVREHTVVESLQQRCVTVRDASGTRTVIQTGVVINAAGIDAPRLTPGLPIVPRKGHLVITDRYPGLCTSEIVELGYLQSAHTMAGESTAFNLQPRATGQMLVGSSRELVGHDASINSRLLRSMLHRAIAFMPALAKCATIRAWTGFRPATPDKLPLIGRWEEVEDLWIAAGHEGLGITLSLGTAELITAGILGRTPAVDPTPFSPMRVMPAPALAGEH
jgi:glycine/D-amino acid oxidase-like deaminating enzyme